MALFTDTIKGQIATLNAVNQQMADQQRLALQQYIIGKQHGDDNLIGIGMRDMGNQGLLANTAARTMDTVRGALKGIGLPLDGYERYSPDLEADTTGFTTKKPVLTDEQKRKEALYNEYKGKNIHDVVKINATKTFKKLYPDEELTDEKLNSFIDTHLRPSSGKGYIKAEAIDNPDIRNEYLSHRATAQEMQKYKPVKDVDKEHREYQERHGIHGMEEFTGNRANKENQAFKFFKAEYDFYKSKGDLKKAQEAQHAYERNMKNIYDFYNDKNYPKKWALLGSGFSQGTGKKEDIGQYQILVKGSNDPIYVSMPLSAIGSRNQIVKHILETNGEAAAERYLEAANSGNILSINDVGKPDVSKTDSQLRAEDELFEQKRNEKVNKGFWDITKRENRRNYNQATLKDPKRDDLVLNGGETMSLSRTVAMYTDAQGNLDIDAISEISDVTNLTPIQVAKILDRRFPYVHVPTTAEVRSILAERAKQAKEEGTKEIAADKQKAHEASFGRRK